MKTLTGILLACMFSLTALAAVTPASACGWWHDHDHWHHGW